MYQLDQGGSVIAACPLTPQELEDFRNDPDTFFGVYKKQGRRVNSPTELFESLLECYKASSKERLLHFLKDTPDFQELQGYSQEDLAEIYCERQVYGFLATGATSTVQE